MSSVPFTHSTTESDELEHVAVHLQPHQLCREPEVAEQRRVVLGRQHGEPALVPVEGRCKGFLARDVRRQHVRDVVEVGRHLDRELAARDEHRRQPLEELGMIREPLERRIGEDDIAWLVRFPVADIAVHEAHAGSVQRTRSLEHRVR